MKLPDSPDDSQKRIKTISVSIESKDDTLTFEKQVLTNVHDNGDVETREINHIPIIENEAINNPAQILGTCRSPECKRYLTQISRRICFICAGIYCAACSTYDERDDKVYCPICMKKIRKKRIIKAILRVFTFPFSGSRNDS